MEVGLIGLAIIVVFLLVVLAAAVKIVKEYERGVVFRLGRLIGPRGPGLILLIPFIERMTKIDLRTVTMDVPAQEVITRDNVTVRVNAVSYFRVIDPSAAVNNVTDYIRATSQIAQTTLRSVLGQSALDELLSERDKINVELQRIIDEQTEPWGVKVSIVEVKDVELPQSMQRAMARQAEAEREKRAKIIHAEGEFQASQQLAQAANVIAREPVALQLRYLQTLTEIGAEKNTTIVFPLPVELAGLVAQAAEAVSGEGEAPANR
jgi:regulator of protease activity HflC (stomatin/prohibitin superfamily)